MTPTAADMAIDLPKMLQETEKAIAYLRSAGHSVPDEAHQMAAIMRRAIAAEEALAAAKAQL